MIKFLKDYIYELKVLNRQLDFQDTKSSAIRGYVSLVGIPLIGILLVVVLLVK